MSLSAHKETLRVFIWLNLKPEKKSHYIVCKQYLHKIHILHLDAYYHNRDVFIGQEL